EEDQETGRAGRDGLPARCVLLFSYADKFKHDYFLQFMNDHSQRQKTQDNLEMMLDYGNLRTCRRRFLVNYFNESTSQENCQNCDNCREQAAPATKAVEATAPRKRSYLPEVKLPPPENFIYDTSLFEKLKKIRIQEAQRLNVPAYIVFGDKALMEMSAKYPKTNADFMKINGVGLKKLFDFGELFMATIREHKKTS
ncbi:HRDC domain-containing protein, partial [Candidatus Parcubacteria bacterium]|nr:HRDC domain-containing protein [Candidatus Parcubacteria bacterium]